MFTSLNENILGGDPRSYLKSFAVDQLLMSLFFGIS
jgi:hypothetical protein